MEIVITGASGLIAGNLIKYLCEKSIRVYGVGRGKTHPIKNKYFSYIQTDWNNFDSIRNILKLNKIDYLIHLAAIQSNDCVENLYDFFEFNIDKSIILANLCSTYNVKKFVFSSTINVHMRGEISGELISPDADNSPYSISKLLFEHYLSIISKGKKTKYYVIRFSNIIADYYKNKPKNNLLFVNDICKTAIRDKKIILNSDPNITKNFITISQACQEVLKICQQDTDDFSIFYVKSDFTYTLYEIAYLVKKRFDIHFEFDLPIIYESKYNIRKITNKKSISNKSDLTAKINEEIDKLLLNRNFD